MSYPTIKSIIIHGSASVSLYRDHIAADSCVRLSHEFHGDILHVTDHGTTEKLVVKAASDSPPDTACVDATARKRTSSCLDDDRCSKEQKPEFTRQQDPTRVYFAARSRIQTLVLNDCSKLVLRSTVPFSRKLNVSLTGDVRLRHAFMTGEALCLQELKILSSTQGLCFFGDGSDVITHTLFVSLTDKSNVQCIRVLRHCEGQLYDESKLWVTHAKGCHFRARCDSGSHPMARMMQSPMSEILQQECVAKWEDDCGPIDGVVVVAF